MDDRLSPGPRTRSVCHRSPQQAVAGACCGRPVGGCWRALAARRHEKGTAPVSRRVSIASSEQRVRPTTPPYAPDEWAGPRRRRAPVPRRRRRRRWRWRRRPDPAAGQRRRAERARLDAAVQGRDRRRHRVGPRRGLLPPGARDDLRRDHRPLRPRRAGRPDHRRRRAAAPRRAGPDRRRAVPPHARRPACRSPPTPATTPRSSARRRSCAGWSTPAPGSCRWATPARARSTTSSTGRRPRSTRSPTSARRRTTPR